MLLLGWPQLHSYSNSTLDVDRLSQNEAALMDPQGRILLEQCGLALADAEPARLMGASELATGVYVGVMHMEYIQYMNGEWTLHAWNKVYPVLMCTC